MSDLAEKVRASVERIRSMESIANRHAFDGTEGYYLAFSGGKDSVAVKALMDMAGVKYDAHYRITSVDPPELVRFIKDKYPDVKFEVPRYSNGSRVTMWNLIPKKLMPPTRLVRYCCEYLREDGGDGRFTVTGVRWAESVNRAKNQGLVTVRTDSVSDNPDFRVTEKRGAVLVNDNVESRQVLDACVTRHKTCLNPIIDWEDSDVWEFIHSENVSYCGLYDEGFERLGCIGCPMARQHGRERQFWRWPKYKGLYIHTFNKMMEERKKRGVTRHGLQWGLPALMCSAGGWSMTSSQASTACSRNTKKWRTMYDS